MQNQWRSFKDPDGVLVPIEFGALPFIPKRVFYVCDIPAGAERGMHAHYETQQVLTCIQGEIIVKLHNGKELTEHTLKPHETIFIDKMIWDSQVFVTGEDILMSMCSTKYDKDDYIEDFSTFLERTKNE